MDQVFAIKQIVEKHCERNMKLFAPVMDLGKELKQKQSNREERWKLESVGRV